MYDRIAAQFGPYFRFLCPVETFFGRGVADSIGRYIGSHPWRRVFIACDPNVWKLGLTQELIGKLGAEYECTQWLGIESEPTDRTVSTGIAVARQFRPDVILAIGGGSVIDSAKVIAVLASQDGLLLSDVLKPSTLPLPGRLPLLALPTTAGTGAEVTRGVVVTDDQRRYKRGFSAGGCFATAAFLDSRFLDAVPDTTARTAGIDAFCHAIESYMSGARYAISDIIATYAIKLIYDSLEPFLSSDDTRHSDAMSLGAYLAALSFSTGGGLTLSHQMSDVLGPRVALPHGYSAALVLPAVLKAFESDHRERASNLRVLLDFEPVNGSLYRDVVGFLRRIGVPHVSRVLDQKSAYEAVEDAFEYRTISSAYDKRSAHQLMNAAFLLD